MSSPAWNVYRTRFLIKAKQLDAPLSFTDPLGREHHGDKGDYLVESADGLQRIAPREIFEDIYVPMGPASATWPSSIRRPALPDPATLRTTYSVTSQTQPPRSMEAATVVPSTRTNRTATAIDPALISRTSAPRSNSRSNRRRDGLCSNFNATFAASHRGGSL